MEFQGLVYLVLYYGALALTLWAFVDAIVRPAAGYVAAGKLSKPAWLAITGVAAAVIFLSKSPLSFLGLPAVIAAIVYLVDVRPAVRGLRRGNGGW
jgi:4-amino-4-deoxy-L-arabinose transferase-like glycosyltransferase